MKRPLVLILLSIVASSAFAVEAQIAGTLHASDGYNYREISVAVIVTPVKDGRLWLNANHSYQLLFSERDRLLSLARDAAKRVDIAYANKTTVSYQQELGSFRTDEGAQIIVSFRTDGYESSYAVVSIADDGNYDLLLLNRKDSIDFVNVLEATNRLVDEYQTQTGLFK
jgi:hypothetical protein